MTGILLVSESGKWLYQLLQVSNDEQKLTHAIHQISAVTAIDTSGIDAISELKKTMEERSLKVRKQSLLLLSRHLLFPWKNIFTFSFLGFIIQFLL